MTDQSREREEKDVLKGLVRSASFQVQAKLLYMLTRVGLPPIILSHVTLEEYGIWAMCFIVISYLGMTAFGVSNVYIRYTAEYLACDETEKISRLLSTGLMATAAVSSVVLVAGWFVLPYAIGLFNISPELKDTAFVLIFATSVTFVLDLTFGSFAYVLHGLQRIRQQTAVWVISFCLEAFLIVVLLHQGLGVYALLVAFVTRYVIATAVYVVLCYRAIPDLSLHPRNFDRESLRVFLNYGGTVQVSGILSILLYSVEKMIAGAFIGIQATGLFDVGQKLAVMSSQVCSSINAVFLPAISYMHAKGDGGALPGLYFKGSRYLSMLTGLMLSFLAAFPSSLLFAWIGDREGFESAPFILAVSTLPYQIHILTGPGSAHHKGVGRPARELVYPLIQIALLVCALAIGFAVWGKTVEVIAVVVAFSMILSALVYNAYNNRLLGISNFRYAVKILFPGLLPYLVALGIAFLARPWIGWAGTDRGVLLVVLGLCGVLHLLVSCVVFYGFVFDPSEREIVKRRIRERLRGTLPKRFGTVRRPELTESRYRSGSGRFRITWKDSERHSG